MGCLQYACFGVKFPENNRIEASPEGEPGFKQFTCIVPDLLGIAEDFDGLQF